MDVINICSQGAVNKSMKARISLDSGAILDYYYNGIPVLRPFKGEIGAVLDPVKTGNFPMLPFGNRVKDNRFIYQDREYHLGRNTEWDPLYLHGDGWICRWELIENRSDSVTLSMRHEAAAGAPYDYYGEQNIAVRDGELNLHLSVRNCGDAVMPFGLGQHLFFPMTLMTTLQAQAKGFWTEKENFLLDERTDIPDDLNFCSGSLLPRRWIDNSFDGWNGEALICWPEEGLGVSIAVREPIDVFLLFQSNRKFEPDFNDDYFCFEPMSHLPNGHNLPNMGGLTLLDRDETLEMNVRIEPFELPAGRGCDSGLGIEGARSGRAGSL